MKLYRIDFYNENGEKIAKCYGFSKRIFKLVYEHHKYNSSLTWNILPLSRTFNNFYKCLIKDTEIY